MKAKCIEAFEKDNEKEYDRKQFRLYVQILQEAVNLHLMRQETLKLKAQMYEVNFCKSDFKFNTVTQDHNIKQKQSKRLE